LATGMWRSFGGCPPSCVFRLVLLDPLVVLLFIIWSWPLSQLASESGDNEDMPACLWPVRSTNLQHTLGVFFMGSLNFEVSLSIRKSAMSLILCLLHCGR
jgi:hypothetical protein